MRRLLERTDAKVGLSHTRTLSLLAAVKARGGSMVTVDEDDVASFLQQLPVHELTLLSELELDDETLEKLRLFGLPNLGSLRQLNRRHLEVQFGTIGTHLHRLLQSVPQKQQLSLYHPPVELQDRERFEDAVNEPPYLEAALGVCLDRQLPVLGKRRAGRLEISLLNRADAPFTRHRLNRFAAHE